MTLFGIYVILLAQCCQMIDGDLQTYYLDTQLCNKRINMSNYNNVDLHSFRLKLSQQHYYPHNLNCSLQVQAEKDSENIMFYFKQFDIRPAFPLQYCQYDWLELHDGNSTDSQYICGIDTKICGISPSRTKGDYFTRTNALTVYFKSDTGEKYTGFDMIITRYRYGECRSDEHTCANGRCIDQSLKCNGYNPCGDGSDCKRLHSGYIMAIVFGAFAVMFLTSSFILSRQLWKYKKALREALGDLTDGEVTVKDNGRKQANQVEPVGESSLLIPNAPKVNPRYHISHTQATDLNKFISIHNEKRIPNPSKTGPCIMTNKTSNYANSRIGQSACASKRYRTGNDTTQVKEYYRHLGSQEAVRSELLNTSGTRSKHKSRCTDSGIHCSCIRKTGENEHDTTQAKWLHSNDTTQVKEMYSYNSTQVKQVYTRENSPTDELDDDSYDYTKMKHIN